MPVMFFFAEPGASQDHHLPLILGGMLGQVRQCHAALGLVEITTGHSTAPGHASDTPCQEKYRRSTPHLVFSARLVHSIAPFRSDHRRDTSSSRLYSLQYVGGASYCQTGKCAMSPRRPIKNPAFPTDTHTQRESFLRRPQRAPYAPSP